MPPASGKFPAAGNANHESRLETGLGKTGGLCGEIRPAERCDGRLVEERKAHAGGDRPDFERALEHSTAAELPGVPPMKRVFEHPAEELTGKRYWRSLGELSDTPEFR